MMDGISLEKERYQHRVLANIQCIGHYQHRPIPSPIPGDDTGTAQDGS